MKHPIGTIVSLMVDHERGVPERVHHFLKVYAFAKVIGESEGLDEREQEIVQIAALMHDVGIRPSLEKYGSSAGPYQEREGSALAREKLAGLEYDPELIERVCFLIAHPEGGSVSCVFLCPHIASRTSPASLARMTRALRPRRRTASRRRAITPRRSFPSTTA